MISMKFISLMVSAIVYYLVGYTMSNNANGGILGQYYNNYHDTTASDDLDWFYKFSMCSISVTIVSGCLAERMQVITYAMYIILMSSVIYPVGSSWILGKGWLFQLGFHDAAGAGYIHMVGGISGLIGTIILGPRYGTFDTYTDFIKERSLSKRKLRLKNTGNLMSYISDDNSSEETLSFLSSN